MHPAIDRECLYDVIDDRPELFEAMLAALEAEAPRLLSEIRVALVEGRTDLLATSAHRLRGAVACFYARACMAAAETLEDMGRSGDISNASAASDAFEHLEREVSRLRDELHLLRKEFLP